MHLISFAGQGLVELFFNDFKQYEYAKLLRGWGRSSATFNESKVKKDSI